MVRMDADLIVGNRNVGRRLWVVGVAVVMVRDTMGRTAVRLIDGRAEMKIRLDDNFI